jgi:hypothetical protein
MAIAQQAGKPLSPDVAAAAIARAEQFLRDVAQLSPMPPGTDPDRAQALPRRNYREFRAPGETTVQRFAREPKTTVVSGLYSDDPKMGLYWDVAFYNGEIKVGVDANSGAIRSFIDGVLSSALHLDPVPASIACISPSTALSRASHYLQAAGINLNELSLKSIRLVDTAYPTGADSRKWEVFWDRLWRGVPYHDADIYVELDAGHGRLITFGTPGLGMIPPKQALLVIPAARAPEIASRFLAARSWPVNGEASVALWIVQPTDYWTTGQYRVTHTDPQSRLAWFVRAPVLSPRNIPMWSEVWVDIATGDVIGGEIFNPGGKASPSAPKQGILQTLGFATRLELCPLAPEGGEARILDSKDDPLKFYGALSRLTAPTTKPGEKPEKLAPTHRLVAALSNGKQATFDYDAKTGKIGSAEEEIVQASYALRALLNTTK